MFENVLVGVDGRPTGRDAIALASKLVDPAGRLTLVHVRRADVAEEREGSLEMLEGERAAAGVQAQLASVVSTRPGRGLHEQAEEGGADLLVVGSCSRGVLGRVMLGDDTRAALDGAPCAVAIATRGYAERPAALAQIGVAYNGSPESAAALAAARELASRTGARVHALEVVGIPSVAYTGIVAPALGQTIEAMLEEAGGRMQQLHGVEGRAVFGLAGEELAAFGEQLDLLVVGSRGYGPMRRLVLGSTSSFLQRHARCPLLVLPRLAGVEDDGSAAREHGAERDADTSTLASTTPV
jgi:nucleotide-binding universal stress UspA family protein